MKETLGSRVAVLETKVEAINSKLDEVRADIKEVHACLHKTRELILEEVKALRAEEKTVHRDQDNRLKALENWRWYVVGICTALVAIAKFLL